MCYLTQHQQPNSNILSLSNRLAVDAISGAQQAINVAMGGYDVEKVRFLNTHVLSSLLGGLTRKHTQFTRL
jgi:hypothetical protein